MKSAQSSRQEKVAEEYVNYLVQTSTPKALPLQEIETQTKHDATLQAVREAVTKGNWRIVSQQTGVNMTEFNLLQRAKDEFKVCSQYGIIVRGTRIIIPST